VRIFVVLFAVDLLVRSFISLTNCDEWADGLNMQYRPKALPGREEFDQIAAGVHPEGYASVAERWGACGRSVAEFFIPWPNPKTCSKLDSALSCGSFALVWIDSRLTFLGQLVGVDQSWPMFSPNVAHGDTLCRFRLVYEDGSAREVRSLADPEDLTRYAHWFEEKHLQAQIRAGSDAEIRTGYCNYLAHRYPSSDSGASLKCIEVFRVHYSYPPPDVDARQFLREQTGPPSKQIEAPFCSYDVRTRREKHIGN
jgi:hypothetical protein